MAKAYQLPGHIGSGRQDPFLNFPVTLTARTRELLDVALDERIKSLRCFRIVYYPFLGFSDLAVFYTVLTYTAMVYGKVQNRPQLEIEAHHYHAQALRLIQARLSDPVDGISNAIIAAVAGLACSSSVLSELNVWETHIQGLRRIVAARKAAGYPIPQYLRTLIFYADTSGSGTRDIRPTFPMPADLLPSLDPLRITFAPSSSVEATLTVWLERWQRPAIAHILQDVAVLMHWMDHEAAENDQFFELSTTPCRWVLPIIQRCLELIPEDDRSSELPGFNMQEAVRHGIILHLVHLQRAFGVETIDTGPRIAMTKAVLLKTLYDWAELTPLLIWIIATAAVEAAEAEDQVWFATLLVNHPQLESLTDNDIVGILRRFIWMDRILDQNLLWLMSQVACQRMDEKQTKVYRESLAPSNGASELVRR